MGNVLLFDVAPETVEWLRSAAAQLDGITPESFDDERALMERVGSDTQPVDAIVLGPLAPEPRKIAGDVRARDPLVSIVWLGPEQEMAAEDAVHVEAADLQALLDALRSCVAQTQRERMNGNA